MISYSEWVLLAIHRLCRFLVLLVMFSSTCGQCCCDNHCRIYHTAVQGIASSFLYVFLARKAVDIHPVQLHLDLEEHDEGAQLEEHNAEMSSHCDCSLTELLSSLELNLD